LLGAAVAPEAGGWRRALRALVLGQLAQAYQLAHAGHQVVDLRAEARLDDVGLLGIEQGQLEHQAGDAGLDVRAQEGQRAGHADREVQRRLAAGADLFAIGGAGEFQRGQHARAVVGRQALQQLFRGSAVQRGSGNHTTPSAVRR